MSNPRKKNKPQLSYLKSRRKKILAAAAKYGASNLRVFGSVVKGTQKRTSDVDFLIDLEPGRGLLAHAGLLVELERLLGCHVDIATEQGLKPRIRDRVLREAIPL